MNNKEIKEIKQMFIDGYTNDIRFKKLYKDIIEIALNKIIASPFAKYNNDYATQELYTAEAYEFNRFNDIVSNKNLDIVINGNDYCKFKYKNNNFIKAINIVIDRLRNNCNYIVIDNEYMKKELKCLHDLNVIAFTNIDNIVIINHNFIFKGDKYLVDYIYTLFYNDDYKFPDININKNIYVELKRNIGNKELKISRAYFDNSKVDIYNKFLVNDNISIENRKKLAKFYIDNYDVNLIANKIDFNLDK